jgi:hypothetical protein
MYRVRRRVETPVETHVEEMQPLNRAKVRTGILAKPVTRAVACDRIRAIMVGWTL